MRFIGENRQVGYLAGAGLLVLALGLAPFTALAQQAGDTSDWKELDDDRTDISFEGVPLDQLEDMDVVRNGEVIGEVDEILGDRNDQVVALVIEYGGNRLGIGEKEVVVSAGQLRMQADQGQVELLMSEEELDLIAADD